NLAGGGAARERDEVRTIADGEISGGIVDRELDRGRVESGQVAADHRSGVHHRVQRLADVQHTLEAPGHDRQLVVVRGLLVESAFQARGLLLEPIQPTFERFDQLVNPLTEVENTGAADGERAKVGQVRPGKHEVLRRQTAEDRVDGYVGAEDQVFRVIAG